MTGETKKEHSTARKQTNICFVKHFFRLMKKEEVGFLLFEARDLPEAQAKVEFEPVTGQETPWDEERVVDDRVRYVLPERNRVLEEDLGRRMRPGMERAVTARYEGEREDDFVYLKIDVREMPPGVYELMVTVKDVRTGRCSEPRWCPLSV